jgi:hypothetical protein
VAEEGKVAKISPFMCPICLDWIEALTTDTEIVCVRCEKVYPISLREE